MVADFEAGLGTLSRMRPGQIDRFLLVAEPTAKSLEVARRARTMIRDGDLGRAHFVANRVATDADERRLELELGADDVTIVPDDPEVRAADARGRAPFDVCPAAPAVTRLRELAASLLP